MTYTTSAATADATELIQNTTFLQCNRVLSLHQRVNNTKNGTSS